MDPVQILQEVLPELSPFLGALALASLAVLVSNAFSKVNKVIFQATVFSAGIAGGIAYLLQDTQGLAEAWAALLSLSTQSRFCLSLVLIGTVYFGGAMYLASPDADLGLGAEADGFPATCDASTSFDVPAVIPADDKLFFEEMFDQLCQEIVADLPVTYELPEEAITWVSNMLDYTVAGGKLNRGLSTVSVRNTFAQAAGHTLTNKERCQAAALGWAIEFLQAFFLVADDLMDDSVTRRGQPCWFRQPAVQTIAVNDSFLLESFVYKILKKYFGAEPYYAQLVDLFLEVTRQTEFGQLLDLTSQPLGQPIDLDRFTIERYCGIVKYKTSFYSFYLPVASGMIVAGIRDRAQYDQAREILMIMGQYFQIQDDYLDCYGAPEVIGKIGTDIQDNKCSWLVVQALDRADAQQRRVLEDNYGHADPHNVAAVKRVYEELGLIGVFAQYEEDSYAWIQTLLGGITSTPKEVFEFLLRKIYKRAK
ncbi:isoprenoid synthase domain-containing protein [Ochromonadaceae sp. CCMP2298]|nr:isoprenoid synthase domain-containing protein [Ochromonadaceae sp. CCMP2298]